MSTSKHPLFGVMPQSAPGDDLVRKLLRKYPVLIDQSSPSKAYHVLMELQRTVEADVPGHVVELGCFEGGTTMLMRRLLHKLKQKKRDLHVFDSWEGVPAPVAQDTPAPGVYGFEKGMCTAQRATFEKNFADAESRPALHPHGLVRIHPRRGVPLSDRVRLLRRRHVLVESWTASRRCTANCRRERVW